MEAHSPAPPKEVVPVRTTPCESQGLPHLASWHGDQWEDRNGHRLFHSRCTRCDYEVEGYIDEPWRTRHYVITEQVLVDTNGQPYEM